MSIQTRGRSFNNCATRLRFP
ncbi:MAG: hypothetical protein D6814_01845 [Calditrichaeota bacterium]|nr:MAG: hypothetical protein D6814_01845 [Calditrichota bacterium]